MLFRRDAGQRLEPMGKMGGSVLHSPGAHGIRHGIGYREIQLLSFADGLLQTVIDIRGQARTHDFVVEYHVLLAL